MRGAVVAVLAALIAALTVSPVHADEQPRVSATRTAGGYEFRHYLVIGDSITYAAWTSDDNGGFVAHTDRSYPEQANVRSIGVGASCWEGCDYLSFRKAILPRLRALDSQPKTLVFHYGVNDLVLGAPATEVIRRAKSVRRTLRHLGYRVVLGTVIPSPRASCWTSCTGPDGTTVQRNRLAFNRWVRTEGQPYVEYARPLECGRVQCPGLTETNDCHVTPKGAGQMARTLRKFIKADS